MRYFTLLLISFLCTCVNAQDVINCGETFYDPGGVDMNYPDDADVTYEICPTLAGEVATVTFTQVDLESCCDFIDVYNGMGTDNFIAEVRSEGEIFTSTAGDGCLTVNFISDGSINEAGFTAVTSCAPPPTCPAPSDVFQEAATTTTITVSWQETGTATEYDLFLTPPGGTPGGMPNFQDVPNPFTLTGLEVDTEYDLYVRADCDGGAGDDESFLIGPTRISTQPLPPDNDECVDAISLGVVQNSSQCNDDRYLLSSATRNPLVPIACADQAAGSDTSGDIWFSFVAPGPSVEIRLEYFGTIGEGDPGPAVEVYSGSCSSLTSIGCRSRVTNLNAGETYYIRLYEAIFDGEPGETSICVISGGDPPDNDDCGGAFFLSVNLSSSCPSGFSGTTLGANQSFVNTCGGIADDDVWYTFTATAANQLLFIDNVAAVGGGFGGRLYYEVFSGDCDGLASIACDVVSSFSSAPEIISGLTVGEEYFIRVYSEPSPTQVTFDICLATPPGNDECGGALGLTVNSDAECDATTPGTTIGSTRSGPDCADGAAVAEQDVWFFFTATRETHLLSALNVDNPNSNFFPQMYFELTAGDCATGMVEECTSLTRNLVNPLSGLTVGQTYYLRVFTQSFSTQATFDLCIGTPPVNDDCDDAITVPVNADLTNDITTAGTSFGGTKSYEIADGTTGCDPFANDDDVWYSFTAIAEEHRVSILNAVARIPAGGFGTENRAVVRIYAAADGCAAPTELSCGFLDGNMDEEFFSGLTPGDEYLLAVQTLGTRTGIEFDLSIKTESPVLPVQLVSFSGRVGTKSNVLTWSVAKEENFSHYRVERSATGLDGWRSIGRVPGAAAGAVNGLKSYEIEDTYPLGKAYYRLRSVDLDGSYELSTLVQLERSEVEGIRVYPNPSTGRFFLDLPAVDGVLNITIYDLNGRLLSTAVSTENLPILEAGLYQVVVTSGNERWVERVVVR